MTPAGIESTLPNMRFSECNLQSWGYAAGLLAAPFFFAFAYLFGEMAGIFAGIAVAGCLLIARTNYEILSLSFGKFVLGGCAVVGLAIAAFVDTQNLYAVLIEGAAFVICVWGLCVALLRRANHEDK